MSDGAYCPHGVNFFDPHGCKKCDAEARGKMRPDKVNGYHHNRIPVDLATYETASDGKLQRKSTP